MILQVLRALPRTWLVDSRIPTAGLRSSCAAATRSRSISTSNCRAPSSTVISTLEAVAFSSPRSPANGPAVTCTASPICTTKTIPPTFHSYLMACPIRLGGDFILTSCFGPYKRRVRKDDELSCFGGVYGAGTGIRNRLPSAVASQKDTASGALNKGFGVPALNPEAVFTALFTSMAVTIPSGPR